MTSYTKVDPTYEAVQWTGDNLDEALTFAHSVFSLFPGEEIAYDAESNEIRIPHADPVRVTDWMVSYGRWGNAASVGMSSVTSDATFQAQFRAVPETA